MLTIASLDCGKRRRGTPTGQRIAAKHLRRKRGPRRITSLLARREAPAAVAELDRGAIGFCAFRRATPSLRGELIKLRTLPASRQGARMPGRNSATCSPLSSCGRARARIASAVRGKLRSRVEKETPLTLSATRFTSFAARSRRKASPTRGEGRRAPVAMPCR
jgi:hypothetical protein